MTKGITSQPCIWCRSSDALTYYEDGAYCFSCHRKQLDKTISLVESKQFATTISDTNYKFIKQALPIEAKAWLYSYHFTDKHIENIGAWYDPSYNRVFIPVDNNDISKGAEARALNGSKPKWLTFGRKRMLVNFDRFTDSAIMVEDLLSYHRLSSAGYSVICLRGTNLRKEDYLVLLDKMVLNGNNPIKLYTWLDGDAPGQKAIKNILTKYYWCASIRWFNVKTTKDPKAYSDLEIKGIIDAVTLSVNKVLSKS